MTWLDESDDLEGRDWDDVPQHPVQLPEESLPELDATNTDQWTILRRPESSSAYVAATTCLDLKRTV